MEARDAKTVPSTAAVKQLIREAHASQKASERLAFLNGEAAEKLPVLNDDPTAKLGGLGEEAVWTLCSLAQIEAKR